jgi:hypothetical protein
LHRKMLLIHFLSLENKILGRLFKRRKPGDLPNSKNNVKLSG